MRDLWKKRLTSLDRLTALEREATRLDGERGQLTAAQAQIAGKIAETGLAIIQIDLDFSSEVTRPAGPRGQGRRTDGAQDRSGS